MSRGMVIVGAGEAGCRAALRLRAEGYDGPVTLVGAEANAPYERPPLSKDTQDGIIAPKLIAAAGQLEEAAIAYLPSTSATAIDRLAKTVTLNGGGLLIYDKLLLATGATPRRLDIMPDHGRILTIRTLEDARRFHGIVGPRVRLVMIGAGFIGLELAASARLRGAEVVVLETQERILKRGVPASIAAVLADRHAAAGVRIVTNARIIAVEPADSNVSIQLEGGEGLTADLVVVGVGASPNIELARACGLSCGNGIVVDARLATNDGDIFAAGDCCSFPAAHYEGRQVRLESWRSAQEQGEHAASAMLGNLDAFSKLPWFWSDQYDLGLQVTGLAEAAVRSVERKVDDQQLMMFHLAPDGRLLAASAIGHGTSVAKDIKIAERMIDAKVRLDPRQLADSNVKLRSLLQSQALEGAA